MLAGSGMGFAGSGFGFHSHFGVGAAKILLAKASTGRRTKVDRMLGELVLLVRHQLHKSFEGPFRDTPLPA